MKGHCVRASQRKRKLMSFYVHFSILALMNQTWAPFWSWTQLFPFWLLLNLESVKLTLILSAFHIKSFTHIHWVLTLKYTQSSWWSKPSIRCTEERCGLFSHSQAVQRHTAYNIYNTSHRLLLWRIVLFVPLQQATPRSDSIRYSMFVFVLAVKCTHNSNTHTQKKWFRSTMWFTSFLSLAFSQCSNFLGAIIFKVVLNNLTFVQM